MAITKHDAILLVYNLGVTFTAGYLVWQLDVTNRIELILLAVGAAVVWTIYFEVAMVDRIADHPRFVDDEESASESSEA